MAVTLDTTMFSSPCWDGRRCRRRPRMRVTTRQACNEPRRRDKIPAADMLLIKPSWWARVGAGTQHLMDRSRARHPEGVMRFTSHIRRQVTSANPASQPQASHRTHLQAVHWRVHRYEGGGDLCRLRFTHVTSPHQRRGVMDTIARPSSASLRSGRARRHGHLALIIVQRCAASAVESWSSAGRFRWVPSSPPVDVPADATVGTVGGPLDRGRQVRSSRSGVRRSCWCSSRRDAALSRGMNRGGSHA